MFVVHKDPGRTLLQHHLSPSWPHHPLHREHRARSMIVLGKPLSTVALPSKQEHGLWRTYLIGFLRQTLPLLTKGGSCGRSDERQGRSAQSGECPARAMWRPQLPLVLYPALAPLYLSQLSGVTFRAQLMTVDTQLRVSPTMVHHRPILQEVEHFQSHPKSGVPFHRTRRLSFSINPLKSCFLSPSNLKAVRARLSRHSFKPSLVVPSGTGNRVR